MNDPSAAQPIGKVSRRFLFVWAVAASAFAVAFGVTTLILYFAIRGGNPRGSDPTSTASALKSDTGQDFSRSNVVSISLGWEEMAGGIEHMSGMPDGQTRIENLQGVPCRYLDPTVRSRGGAAYLYFVVSSTFKTVETKAARIDFEYFTLTATTLKVQYDGMEGDRHRPFMPAQPGELRVPGSPQWRTASFRITDAAFLNSQNGGADFRLDVIPPEIYVRRVTLTREN